VIASEVRQLNKDGRALHHQAKGLDVFHHSFDDGLPPVIHVLLPWKKVQQTGYVDCGRWGIHRLHFRQALVEVCLTDRPKIHNWMFIGNVAAVGVANNDINLRIMKMNAI